MKLNKKKSITEWIEVDKSDPNIKFKIDYPSISQSEFLQDIILNTGLEPDDNKQKLGILKYYRYLAKYSIKGWQGLNEEFRLIIRNGESEWEDKQWWEAVEDFKQAFELGALLESELGLTETDKKK